MKAALFLSLLLLLASCGSPRLQKPVYYSLTKKSLHFIAKSPDRKIIGLGPLELAEHLDRPQLVRKDSSGKLLVYSQHRWTEPLENELKRALQLQLEALDSKIDVLVHPWYRNSSIALQVPVHIKSFEPNEENRLELQAVFYIVESSGHRHIRNINLSRKLADKEFSSQVQAMNHLLDQLAQEIYKELRPKLTPRQVHLEPPLSAEAP